MFFIVCIDLEIFSQQLKNHPSPENKS